MGSGFKSSVRILILCITCLRRSYVTLPFSITGNIFLLCVFVSDVELLFCFGRYCETHLTVATNLTFIFDYFV